MRCSRLSRGCVLVFALMAGLWARTVEAGDLTFETGSLIIPMDTTYQPLGLFKAFGLVDKLLLANVPVHWAIKPGKVVGNPGDADFVASAVDVQSGDAITSYGYRGGPFLVAAADATAASAVVADWQAAHVTVEASATAQARLLTWKSVRRPRSKPSAHWGVAAGISWRFSRRVPYYAGAGLPPRSSCSLRW